MCGTDDRRSCRNEIFLPSSCTGGTQALAQVLGTGVGRLNRYRFQKVSPKPMLCRNEAMVRKLHLVVLATTLFELLLRNTVQSFSTPMPSYIDKLALILVRGRKQLVARSRGKSVFFTPGGKRETGESDSQALCRECQEELTIKLKENTIKPYGVFEAQAFGKPEGTMVRMTCYMSDFNGDLNPSEEVEELAWIDSKFDREKLSVTGIMILEDLKQKDLID